MKISTVQNERRRVKLGQHAFDDEVLKSKIDQYADMNENSAAVKYLNIELR